MLDRAAARRWRRRRLREYGENERRSNCLLLCVILSGEGRRMPPPRSRSFAERSNAARAEQNRGEGSPSRGIYKRLRTACQRKVRSIRRGTSNPIIDPCGEGKAERALFLLLAFCSEQGLPLAKSSTPLRSAQDDTKGIFSENFLFPSIRKEKAPKPFSKFLGERCGEGSFFEKVPSRRSFLKILYRFG